jgi:uncharacterized cupin superfamily protein
MRKVNTNAIGEISWSSPKGTFGGAGIQVSEALGRKPKSTDLLERHPFDVEILRVAPGMRPYPYHAHAAQWEFYHVISEPHQIINDGATDLVVYVIADNPLSEATYFPDSDKCTVPLPERHVVRASPKLDYMDGEE